MTTYAEKLKDPRWQKRRLEILERDNWTCQVCESTDRTLHVHHIKYTGEPWDTPGKYLQTLCDLCHDDHHTTKKALKRINESLTYHLDPVQIEELADALEDMKYVWLDVLVGAMCWALSDLDGKEAADAFVKAYEESL